MGLEHEHATPAGSKKHVDVITTKTKLDFYSIIFKEFTEFAW